MTNSKVARKVEIIAKRGDIHDVTINGKYVGSVIFREGHGYSCGQQFHEALHLAVHALAERHK